MIKKDFIDNIQKLFDNEVLTMRKEEQALADTFRMSGIADCPRKAMFYLLNLPDDKYPKAKSDDARGFKLMRRGTDDHKFVQSVLIHMGLMTEDDLEDAKRVVDKKLLISGHPDGILTFGDGERVLLELKTINGKGWSYIKEPKKEHFYQAQGYIRFIGLQYGIQLSGVLFVYINRESDGMEFKPFWIDRDDKVGDMIVNKLKVMGQYLKKGQIYPIPPGYNPEDPTVYECRYCPFNTLGLCHSGKTNIADFPEANIKANIQDIESIV